jgi:hypothetical protein
MHTKIPILSISIELFGGIKYMGVWGHAPHDGSSSNQPFASSSTTCTPPSQTQREPRATSETHCIRPLTNSRAQYHDHPAQWLQACACRVQWRSERLVRGTTVVWGVSPQMDKTQTTMTSALCVQLTLIKPHPIFSSLEVTQTCHFPCVALQ